MSNVAFFLALNRMEHVGPRTVKRLLQKWPDLQHMFRLSERELLEEGLTPKLVNTLLRFDMRRIEADIIWSKEDSRHHLLTWDSPDYPSLLKEIPDPPIVLYAKGQLSALKNLSVAIIGSRNPTITGSENAQAFAKELALNHISIVSGLALGIDAQAHRGCLNGMGQTVAVMGTGIDLIYPRNHVGLAEEITENGLLLTEYPLKSPPLARHFPQRNRIISGLSLATLVVEAALKSGSLITARMAVEQNRDVFAIPGSIHNPVATGCHYLLQQGAKLVTNVNDIFEELGISPTTKSESVSSPPVSRLDEHFLNFVGYEVTTIDQIISRSGFAIERVLTEVADSELKGNIVSVPGGYMRCKNER